MERRSILIGAVAFGAAATFSRYAQADSPAGFGEGSEIIITKPDAIKWQPMPKQWADGPPPPPGPKMPAEVVVIWGDPTKEGEPFIFRMRPAESGAAVAIPPHWHPIDENITVLSGVFSVGMGDKYDENACQDMPAGSYMTLPKNMHHFAVSKNSVIQVHGIGPFKINWIR